jgi:N-acetylglutamate synthase-like GNAT family acetyltransferase
MQPQVISADDDLFETKAIRIGSGLLEFCFGCGIPEGYFKQVNMCHALWISEEDCTIAFAMISKEGDGSAYKLHGVCVDPNFRNQGHGTALVKTGESLLPAGSTLRLCVDNYEDNTIQLCNWYTRLGFEREDPSFPETLCDDDDFDSERGECREIAFRKLVTGDQGSEVDL